MEKVKHEPLPKPIRAWSLLIENSQLHTSEPSCRGHEPWQSSCVLLCHSTSDKSPLSTPKTAPQLKEQRQLPEKALLLLSTAESLLEQLLWAPTEHRDAAGILWSLPALLEPC